MDNYFEVKFILENASGQNFEAPDFSENFNVISGPNFSTSMSIVNGEVTQSMKIGYYLEPKDIGAFYILPASVEASGEIIETIPMEVLVVPNPDGIKQSPMQRGDTFNMELGDPFNFGDLFQGFDMQMPFDLREMPEWKELTPQPPAEQKEGEEPKKKRKTIRI